MTPAVREKPIEHGPRKRLDCSHPNAVLGWKMAANGHRHAVDFCPRCGGFSKNYGTRWLEQRGVCLADLEAVAESEHVEPCGVCGTLKGSELHHWAPESLDDWFEEPHRWPTVWLCPRHHDEWHRIVTPSDTVSPSVTLGQLQVRQGTTVHDVQDKLRERLRKEAAA